MTAEFRNAQWRRTSVPTEEGITSVFFSSDDGELAVTISEFDLIKLHAVLSDLIYLRAMPGWRDEAERRWQEDTALLPT